MTREKTTAKQWALMMSYYNSNAKPSFRKACAKFGIKPSTGYAIVRRGGIELRPAGEVKEDQWRAKKSEALSLVMIRGMKICEAAKVAGVNRSTVSYWIKEARERMAADD